MGIPSNPGESFGPAEDDPSFATEENLERLLASIVTVEKNEGQMMTTLDANMHPYYSHTYAVSKDADAFRAIEAIARVNPAAFSERIRARVMQLRKWDLDSLVTRSDTHIETTYVADPESAKAAEEMRQRICGEIEALFAVDKR